MNNVIVVGLWHQGVVAAACLADWGYSVTAIDSDPEKISRLNEGKAPIYEPGLDQLLNQGILEKRLVFSTAGGIEIKNAQIVLIAHDTPVNENDISDLTGVFKSIEELSPHLNDGVIIHVTAQVPVGTCDQIARSISLNRPALKFHLAYSPENLRLGQAINLYRTPMLPVIGSDDFDTFKALERFYSKANVNWQFCTLKTAEMLKHSLNSFLALSITFANELGNLCDKIGVDGHRLGQLLRLEPRIGTKAMLMPGLGFSGGTLARDVQTLRVIGERVSLGTGLLDALWSTNQLQNKLVTLRLKDYFKGSIKGKKICVLGLTYKPDTSTLRRSAALEIIDELVSEGAIVVASDPMADREELKSYKQFKFYEAASDAWSCADALLLITPWIQYKNLNFIEVQKNMNGKLVFDTASIWKEANIVESGLEYMNIGGGKLFGKST
jgi:UDPglucose 6-dehydrogenase